MLTPDATLIDVAFSVCTALDRIGECGLLVGGSAATYYAPESHQSSDCDFILTFGARGKNITAALADLGFSRARQGFYRHANLIFTVEFPVGPAYIGIDLIETYATHHRSAEMLHVYTPTDVVRDRFMHFWAWGDFSALRVALDVATVQRSSIDFDAVRAWTDREMSEAPAAYDPGRRDLFINELREVLNA
jgi:hypothetical protein